MIQRHPKANSATIRVLLPFVTCCISVNGLAQAAEPATAPARLKIVLCGDSTVTDNAGWALGFKKHLAPDVELVNLSKGGRSSGSFVAEGKWATALSMKPDYVLIQFGHNDQPGHGDRESDPATTYREHMLRYITDARAAGVIPVLVTPLSRRQWDAAGVKIDSTLQPYADAVKKIAADEHVPVIDLHAMSIAMYERLGKAEVLTLSPPKNADPKQTNSDTATTQNAGYDGTHLNEKGSDAVGMLVADEMRKAVPALADAIKP